MVELRRERSGQEHAAAYSSQVHTTVMQTM